jgi:hypothetical protein
MAITVALCAWLLAKEEAFLFFLRSQSTKWIGHVLITIVA